MSGAKIRRARVKKRDPDAMLDNLNADLPPVNQEVEPIWRTLNRPTSSMNLSPEIMEFLQGEVLTALTGRVFVIADAGNVWEGVPDGAGDYSYRTIIAVGGERLVFDSWYVGKKKGVILRFKPCSDTVFAGTEVKGVLEYSLSSLASKKRILGVEGTDKSIGSVLEVLPCMQNTALELTLNLETHKKSSAEKVKVAEVAQRVERHGEQWGSW